MKIVKHTFCHLGDKCLLIGKEATVTDKNPAIGNPGEKDYQKPWYWARVEGIEHKFQEGDLE